MSSLGADAVGPTGLHCGIVLRVSETACDAWDGAEGRVDTVRADLPDAAGPRRASAGPPRRRGDGGLEGPGRRVEVVRRRGAGPRGLGIGSAVGAGARRSGGSPASGAPRAGAWVAGLRVPAGLPGADWWVAGPVVARPRQDAVVDIDDVERLFARERPLDGGVRPGGGAGARALARTGRGPPVLTVGRRPSRAASQRRGRGLRRSGTQDGDDDRRPCRVADARRH